MGASPQTIGGGSARGVSDQLSQFLMMGLQGGFNLPQFGQTTPGDALNRSNPVRSTMNFGDAIGTLLQGGGFENDALSIAANRREENVGNIRSRYALGGTGYGTPAAVGEARFLGEFDPQVATQVGGMRLDSIGKALSFMLPLYQQAYGLGTPQAQTVMKPGFLSEALGTVTGLAGAAAPFFAPGLGGGQPNAAQQMASGGFGITPPATLPYANARGGQLGQASMYHLPSSGFLPQIEGIGSAFGGHNNGFGFPRDSFGTAPANAWRLW